jgi:hypothetical protein
MNSDTDFGRLLVFEDVFEDRNDVSTADGGGIKNLNQVKSAVHVKVLLAHDHSDQLNGATISLHSLSESLYNYFKSLYHQSLNKCYY